MSAPVLQHRFCPTCRRIYEGDLLFCSRDGTPLDPAVEILAGKYVLGKQLGSGSMGVVYEAEQPAMERLVAIKLLHPERTRDPEMIERFEREARAAGKISHKNVITIYESGQTSDGKVYLAMERLHGEGLADVLSRERRLPPERAVPLFMQAVRGMAAAHAKGVVHRDLKPDNLFIVGDQDEDGGERVKILDFGIAKLQTARSLAAGTADGTVLGTLRYMAPEQLEGRPVDPRADVYALGLILVEMLSGRLPWGTGRDKESLVTYWLRLTQPPQPLADLCPSYAAPDEWQEILNGALAVDPGRRPAHAGELLDRVKQALASAPPPWPLRTQVLPGPPAAPAERPGLFQSDVTVANVEWVPLQVAQEAEDLTSVNMEGLPLAEVVSRPTVPHTGPAPLAERSPDNLVAAFVQDQEMPTWNAPSSRPTLPARDGRTSSSGQRATITRRFVGPRLWIAAGIATFLAVLSIWLWPRGPVPKPKPDLRAAAAEKPVPPPRGPAVQVQTPPQDKPVPEAPTQRPAPPAPRTWWFRAEFPKQVEVRCGGKLLRDCTNGKGCQLPPGWSCTASSASDPGLMPHTYTQADADKHNHRITVKLYAR